MFEVFFTPSYLDWLANKNLTGGSPGLVVMGGDSRFKGREFESRHRILDGNFSHLFVVKLYFVFEKTKINEKSRDTHLDQNFR